MTDHTSCTGVRVIDPIQGLIDYVNDTKPYHTKVVDVLVEYTYNEGTAATITDTAHIDISIDLPNNSVIAVCDNTGINSSPFGDSGQRQILSPNPDIPFEVYPAISPITNSIILSGDHTQILSPGTVFNLVDFVENAENLYKILDVNVALAGSAHFDVIDSSNTFFSIFSSYVNSPTLRIGATGTVSDDNIQFVVTAIQQNTPAVGTTRVSVDVELTSINSAGYLGFLKTTGNNTGIYTVSASTYSGGTLDSWPGYPDVGTYVIGDNPNTTVLLDETITSPIFNSTTETYVAYIELTPIPIQQVFTYSRGSSANPDEGVYEQPIISVALSTLDNAGLVVPDSGKFEINGNIEQSNVYVGDKLQVKQSSGNDGIYEITSITYTPLVDSTFIGVAEQVDNTTFDGVAVLTIPSNSFAIVGDYTSRFTQGTTFDVLGGTLAGTYTTLYSRSVNNKTLIRPTSNIINSSIGEPITTISSGFVITGDYTTTYQQGSQFNVHGSEYNDGVFTVNSVVYNVGTNQTTITPIGDYDQTPISGGYVVQLILGLIIESQIGIDGNNIFCSVPEGLAATSFSETLEMVLV